MPRLEGATEWCAHRRDDREPGAAVGEAEQHAQAGAGQERELGQVDDQWPGRERERGDWPQLWRAMTNLGGVLRNRMRAGGLDGEAISAITDRS